MIDFTTRAVSNSTVVVEIRWSLNDMNRRYLFDCLQDLLDSGLENIILECHGLGRINSMSLASLLIAKKKAAKRGGRIYLTHVGSSLAEVLEITRLGQLLAVYPTTEDALACIRSDRPSQSQSDSEFSFAAEA